MMSRQRRRAACAPNRQRPSGRARQAGDHANGPGPGGAPDAVVPGDDGDLFVELDQGQYSSAQIKGKLAMAKGGIRQLLFVVPGPNRAAEVARIAARTLGPDALQRVGPCPAECVKRVTLSR